MSSQLVLLQRNPEGQSSLLIHRPGASFASSALQPIVERHRSDRQSKNIFIALTLFRYTFTRSGIPIQIIHSRSPESKYISQPSTRLPFKGGGFPEEIRG